jgi:hypothetical protein
MFVGDIGEYVGDCAIASLGEVAEYVGECAIASLGGVGEYVGDCAIASLEYVGDCMMFMESIEATDSQIGTEFIGGMTMCRGECTATVFRLSWLSYVVIVFRL